MQYQSVSGLLQLYAKSGRKFIKVAPATYAVIEPAAQVNDETNEQTVVYETGFNEAGGNSDVI